MSRFDAKPSARYWEILVAYSNWNFDDQVGIFGRLVFGENTKQCSDYETIGAD